MNWGLIGHGWAVNLLAEHVAHHAERHAYLITGPSGVGRRTLGLRFAQALYCLKPPVPGEPCRKCSTCKRIERMVHPDLAVVQAEQEGHVLKIDQVRELQHNLSLAPYEGRYRLAMVLRFEEANANAANALLKTLEEPPTQVVVILTANNAESLLPTIVSRCEVIRLRPVAIEETSMGLQNIKGITKEQSEKLAHLADGRPGYAIRLFEQPGLLEQRQAWLDDLLRLLTSPRRERFAFARGIVENKEDLRNELLVWLTFWRDVLICVSGVNQSITNLDLSTQVQKLAKATELKKVHFYVGAIEQTMDKIDRNVNARLAMEVLFMDLPRINIIEP
jgi:DNA polymerase III subunit delta'